MRTGTRAGQLLLLVYALALPASAHAQTVLATNDFFDQPTRPIGFVGADLVASDEERIVTFRDGKIVASVRETGLRTVLDQVTRPIGDLGLSVGDGVVAYVRERAAKLELRAGPVTGPLTTLATCPTTGKIMPTYPAVAGTRVVWRSCDTRRVVVFEGGARREIDAGGGDARVVAAGDRLLWTSVVGDELLVRTHDLTTGVTTPVGTLGEAERSSPQRLSIAPDGRLRAARVTLGSRSVYACVSVDGVGRPAVTTASYCPTVVAYLPTGRVELLPAFERRGAIVVRDGAGAVISTIHTFVSLERPAAVAGDQIAVSTLGCRREELVLTTLSTRLPGIDCAPVPTSRRVRASRTGVVVVPVRCRDGCSAVPGGIDLRVVGRGDATTESFLDLAAGRLGHLRFRLTAPQRRALQRRGTLKATVSALTSSGAQPERVTLLRPRP